MSRGFDFDSFEMDDFRESDSYDRSRETGAGRGGNSPSGASSRLHLQRLRKKETISDRRVSQAEISRARLQTIGDLPPRSDRERTQYSDRNRMYSLIGVLDAECLASVVAGALVSERPESGTADGAQGEFAPHQSQARAIRK